MMLEYVREFVALADTHNLADAADLLFISQSSLSRHIRAFESELGVQLFDRTATGIKLNENGVRLLPYAKNILYVADQSLQKFLNEMRILNGTLKVGTFTLEKQYDFTDGIFQFNDMHKELNVVLIEDRSDMLCNSVVEGDCDFAFVMNKSDFSSPVLETIHITEDRYVAIIPTSNPLSESDCISFEQLKDETILMRGYGPSCDLFVETARDAGFEPRIVFQNLQVKSIIQLVGRGRGIAFYPEKLSSGRGNPSVKVMNFQPELKLSLDLVYRKDKILTEIEKEFIRYFSE